MSTHCTVSVKHEDGSVSGIYVHNDGYISHMGNILLESYDSAEAAEELVSLGDASIIYPVLRPDPSLLHSFNDPQKGVSVFYSRDRGEPWKFVKPTKCSYDNVPEWLNQEYNYIFCNGSWYMWDRKHWYNRSDEERLIPLKALVTA